MAGEQPKKPVGGAYGQFLAANRAELTKELSGQKASAVAKLAGERWKAASEAEKAKWQKKYEEVKAKFDADMAAFLAAGGEKAPRKAKGEKGGRKKKDKAAPKRPGSAYSRFLNASREDISKECEGLDRKEKFAKIAKIGSDRWKALSEADKKPYEDEYKKAQEEYKKAMAAYKASNPGAAGGDEDEDGDDDEDDDEEEEEDAAPAPKKRAKKA